jgi:hypothetical protein
MRRIKVKRLKNYLLNKDLEKKKPKDKSIKKLEPAHVNLTNSYKK